MLLYCVLMPRFYKNSITSLYVDYRAYQYCWGTERYRTAPNPDKPWVSWRQYGDDGKPDQITWFATRASAKRCAVRRCESHERRNERQRKEAYRKSRCGNCETNRKMKDDYLCAECRGY